MKKPDCIKILNIYLEFWFKIISFKRRTRKISNYLRKVKLAIDVTNFWTHHQLPARNPKYTEISRREIREKKEKSCKLVPCQWTGLTFSGGKVILGNLLNKSHKDWSPDNTPLTLTSCAKIFHGNLHKKTEPQKMLSIPRNSCHLPSWFRPSHVLWEFFELQILWRLTPSISKFGHSSLLTLLLGSGQVSVKWHHCLGWQNNTYTLSKSPKIDNNFRLKFWSLDFKVYWPWFGRSGVGWLCLARLPRRLSPKLWWLLSLIHHRHLSSERDRRSSFRLPASNLPEKP